MLVRDREQMLGTHSSFSVLCMGNENSREHTSLMILIKLSSYTNCREEGYSPSSASEFYFSLPPLACQGRCGLAK